MDEEWHNVYLTDDEKDAILEAIAKILSDSRLLGEFRTQTLNDLRAVAVKL